NSTPYRTATPTKTAAGHNAITYTQGEIDKTTAWLNKEVEVRSNGNATTPPTGTGTESPSEATTRLLAQWSGCMSQANFDTAKMADAWGNLTASNGNRCKNCHVNAAEGFIATDQ